MNRTLLAATIAALSMVPSLSYCEALQPWESDPAAAIGAVTGQAIVLALRSNSTTGYSWEAKVTEGASSVRVVDHHYVDPDSRALGAVGKELWTFEALKPGKATVVMTYRRSWEKDRPAAATRSYRVTVSPKSAQTAATGAVKAKPGHGFAVILPSNQSTGYSWGVASNSCPSVAKPVGTNYVAPTKTGVVGASGIEVWTFDALAAGKTDITLEYRRSWENVPKPAKTRTLHVTVK